jgi:hypothetical protein
LPLRFQVELAIWLFGGFVCDVVVMVVLFWRCMVSRACACAWARGCSWVLLICWTLCLRERYCTFDFNWPPPNWGSLFLEIVHSEFHFSCLHLIKLPQNLHRVCDVSFESYRLRMIRLRLHLIHETPKSSVNENVDPKIPGTCLLDIKNCFEKIAMAFLAWKKIKGIYHPSYLHLYWFFWNIIQTMDTAHTFIRL